MKKGDVLYGVFGSSFPVNLEIVTVVKEDYAPGAKEKTLVCKDKVGGVFRCSKDMYSNSVLEAWQKYQLELEKGINWKIERIQKQMEWLSNAINEKKRVDRIISLL